MPTPASILLLAVAAGLLLLAGVSIGRLRGRQASGTTYTVMAAMTGTALGFLLRLLWVAPLIVFPLAVAGILIAAWLSRREWRLLGAFLVGAGGLWAAMEVLALANDLADPAVTIPGWTPIPLAIGVAAAILGVTGVLIGGASADR